MEVMNNTGEIDVEARKELLVIKGNAPKIWEALIKSNLCPMDIGLPCTCDISGDCRACWEKAMDIDEIDSDVKLSLNGKLFCNKDKDFLVKVKNSNGAEVFECPTCHAIWDIKKNDKGNIQSIKKHQTEDEAEAENDTSQEITEAYNEE